MQDAISKEDWDNALVEANKLRKLDPSNIIATDAIKKAGAAKQALKEYEIEQKVLQLQEKKVVEEIKKEATNYPNKGIYKSALYRPWEYQKAMQKGTLPNLDGYNSQSEINTAIALDAHWKTMGEIENFGNSMNNALDNWIESSTERLKQQQKQREQAYENAMASNRNNRTAAIQNAKERNIYRAELMDEIIGQYNTINYEPFKAIYGVWNDINTSDREKYMNYFESKIDLNAIYTYKKSQNKYLFYRFRKEENKYIYCMVYNVSFDEKKYDINFISNYFLAYYNNIEDRKIPDVKIEVYNHSKPWEYNNRYPIGNYNNIKYHYRPTKT